ncbi:hypothetical protein F4778DRAFT_181870 [Xylariomycetidae sp. FL2044]|nr:hypothetical protein F4778DRAFT_181870 [Xylariomycetidae sp. FL2044]
MYTKTTITAVAGLLASSVNAHMIMKNPKPFGGDGLDNSPLTSGNFPCKVKGDPATFYKRDGLESTVAVGETQTLEFTGSAVHGGGSCQLALTKDLQPSASSSWEVILSIEGGCPSKTGQGADTYDFKIPEGVAPGDYVFAWTWISKLAGQPEYYMNCSPLKVTGGSAKKRSEVNETTMELFPRDGLPELFVANLADINDCKTTPSSDPEFPDPGPNVERPGSSNSFAKVSGSNCVPKGAKAGTSSGSSGSASDSGSESSSASSSASGSTASSGASSGDSSSGSSSGNDGMYHGEGSSSSSSDGAASSGFVTSVVASLSSSAAAASAAPSSSSAAATTQSSAPAKSSSSPASSSSGSAAAGGSSSSSSSSSSAGGLSGACTDEGMFNCVGGTSYQQCASGAWTALQQMPATTKCAAGQTMTLWGRDESPRSSLRLRRATRAEALY